MGAGPRPAAAQLSRRAQRWAGASPVLRDRGRDRRAIGARGRGRGRQARGREAGRRRLAGAARGMNGAAPTSQRCGYVALVGVPNAGKSTLLNALIGSKVSIVTPKVQTTRSRVLGIVIEGAAQLVFVDTPGIFTNPKRRLERAMVAAAWSGAGDADWVALLIDAERGLRADDAALLEGLAARGRPMVLVLNKIDLVRRERLLELAASINDKAGFEATFMISASTGDGVADLRQALGERMPEGPWVYPEDQLADMPLRLMAAEFTREQLFVKLHDELPYSAMVETDRWQEFDDGSVRIDQTIFIERDSQKAIVVGKGGRQIRAIGEASRVALGTALDRTV